MNIPFNDLHAQYLSLKPEIDEAIARVIKNSSFVRGPEVDSFEENFANLIDIKNCVSCANGTDALYISMNALGLKSGDEVIVPAHSWISTSETVTQSGGKVIFCDTRDEDFTIDVSEIENKISKNTVGIIPVHLYGHPAQMEEIMALAKKHSLWVIEDCAQAHLATFKGKKIGKFGDIATFSFYPGKNLGAMGDAGALVTDDNELAERAARFARHGGLVKGMHEIEGINSRLDGIQAAILNVKLSFLKDWTSKRQEIAKTYIKHLKNLKNLKLPYPQNNVSHVWHLFVIRALKRDELQRFLLKNGIKTLINYPIALPFLKAYSHQNNKFSDFPIAYKHQNEVLSLPIFPEMTEEMIIYIADKISEFI